MGAGDANHVVTQIPHQALEIHRDEGLVLDDQHIGRDFRRHFPPRRIGEPAGLGDVGSKDECHLFLGEAFQGQQQERLARQRGDV